MRYVLSVVGLIIVLFSGYILFQRFTPHEQSVFSPVPATSRKAPTGFAAVKEYQSDTGESILPETYKNPSIDGVIVRIDWKDLEPQENSFRWQILDSVFSQARANGKWVGLIIVPGFGTPDWALSGVKTGLFDKKYGRGSGQKAVLPLPWNAVYINRWLAFLTEVSIAFTCQACVSK